MSGRTSRLINATSATERNVSLLLFVVGFNENGNITCFMSWTKRRVTFFGSGHTYRKIAPWQALVAQRCNLSRETLLFGWICPRRAGFQTPAMTKWRPLLGVPTTKLLYQGAGSAGRTQDRRVAHSNEAERKVASLSPTTAEDFSGLFSSSIAIKLIHFIMCLTCSWCIKIIYNAAACNWWCLWSLH